MVAQIILKSLFTEAKELDVLIVTEKSDLGILLFLSAEKSEYRLRLFLAAGVRYRGQLSDSPALNNKLRQQKTCTHKPVCLCIVTSSI